MHPITEKLQKEGKLQPLLHKATLIYHLSSIADRQTFEMRKLAGLDYKQELKKNINAIKKNSSELIKYLHHDIQEDMFDIVADQDDFLFEVLELAFKLADDEEKKIKAISTLKSLQ